MNQLNLLGDPAEQIDLFGFDAPPPIVKIKVKAHDRAIRAEPSAKKLKPQVAETSREALESVHESAASLRERVYAVILGRGSHGATDQELQSLLKMHEQTQGPRRNELVKLGQVVDSGTRRPTRSGRTAKVWVAATHFVAKVEDVA